MRARWDEGLIRLTDEREPQWRLDGRRWVAIDIVAKFGDECITVG